MLWIYSVNFKKINSLFNIEGDHNISGTPRSAVLQTCTLTSGFLLARGLLFSQVNFSSWDGFDKFDNNPWITWVSCLQTFLGQKFSLAFRLEYVLCLASIQTISISNSLAPNVWLVHCVNLLASSLFECKINSKY